MPRRKNNGFINESSILTTLEELTVNDVANSERKRQCLKKSDICGAATRAYQNTSNNREVSMPDRLIDDDDDIEMDELGSSHPPVTGTKRKRRRKSESLMECSGSVTLPIDFWELISEHIRPEDVGLFASICRTTAYVVSTARFWYSLYDRYCGHTPMLLDDISQWEIRRYGPEGLRSRVVRSLYLVYPPFSRGLHRAGGGGGPHHKPYSTDTIIAPTDRLLHSRCLIYWHDRRGSSHHYFFKFFQRDRLPNQALFGRRLGDADSASQKLQPLSCRHAEDACYIMEVVCSGVCQIPHTCVGQYLNLVCENPAEVTNYRMNKIELTLSGAPYTYSNRNYAAHNKNNVYRPIGWNDVTKVVLQPVTSVRVLPWWDSLYINVCNPAFSYDDCDKLDDVAW